MKIPDKAARSIVQEIHKAVHQDVNLMDKTGLIIASTDSSREGTRHVGAQRIVEEKLEYLPVSTNDEYSGAKVGINMPISFQGEIVGVIGISGEWSQISQYIHLIRRITEVLLIEAFQQEKADDLRAQRQLLMHDLFSEDLTELDEDMLRRADQLRLNLLLPRRCLCLSFSFRHAQASQTLPDLLRTMQRRIEQLDCHTVVYAQSPYLFAFFAVRTDEELLRLSHLLKSIPLPEGVCLHLGADDGPCTGFALRQSRRKAEKSICSSQCNGSLVFYNELTYDIFLSEIPKKTQEEYVFRIFSGMDREQITEWCHFLEVFYACSGSVNQTADRLFLHKNTVQYKLKKLASITGYDPRSIEHAGLYQTAMHFVRFLF